MDPGTGRDPLPPPPPSHRSAERRTLRIALLAGTVIVIVGIAVAVASFVQPGDEADPETSPRALLHERFSGGGTDVSVGASVSFRAAVANGQYLVEITQPRGGTVQYLTSGERRWRAVAAQATVVLDPLSPAGLVGIGCAHERHRGYAFVIDLSTSRFALLRNETTLLAGDAADGTVLAPSGEPNRLRAECELADGGGARLRFLVNGELVGAFDDPTANEGFRDVVLGMSAIGVAGVRLRIDDVMLEQIASVVHADSLLEPMEMGPDPPLVGYPITDSFSDPNSGWCQSRDARSVFEYVLGEYRIFVKRRNDAWTCESVLPRAFEAVAVHATVRRADLETGPASSGVFCVGAERRARYEFLVDPDVGGFRIVRTRGRTFDVLDEGVSGAVSFGAEPTDVLGECVNEDGSLRLRMSLNGFLVREVVDPSGPGAFRGVGMIVETGAAPADVRFDDIFMARLRSG